MKQNIFLSKLGPNLNRWLREDIIVPLDRRFVVYPGGAGVDEDAGVDKGEEECPASSALAAATC